MRAFGRINLVAAMALGLSLSAVGSASAQSRTFNVQRARATFTSEAQLETINGICNSGSGSVSVDPGNLSSASGTITVPVACLETGIDERDQHLRSAQWLDAGAHPNATFEITGVSGASSLSSGQEARVRVSGRFTIHGQTRDVTANARVRWDGSGQIQLRANFSIQLSDYGVSIPSVVQAKVSNTIRISVRIRAEA
ncbi:MAG: YceI family protein [Myxococcota bacterium]